MTTDHDEWRHVREVLARRTPGSTLTVNRYGAYVMVPVAGKTRDTTVLHITRTDDQGQTERDLDALSVLWNTADALLEALARERRRTAAVRGLIEYRDTSDLCQCSHCRTVIERTGTFTCETCGYVGPVATMECACYDYSCSGEGGGGRGAGCWHGVATCPECRDGDRDVWELLRAIRTALADDAPGRPGGEGEGE